MSELASEFLFFASFYLLVGYFLSRWLASKLQTEINKMPMSQEDYNFQSDMRFYAEMFRMDYMVKSIYLACMLFWPFILGKGLFVAVSRLVKKSTR